MIKDITLGQYFPGNSIIHKLDPRVKLILTILYIVVIFLAKSAFSYFLCLLVTITMIPVSGIKLKVVLKSLKPLLFIIIFTTVINLFFTKGDGQALISFWKINIYTEGIFFAVYMTIRILCLLAGTSVLLTYTTSPISLTDGIEQLLSPLAKIHVPIHEFAMMLTTALRFIPTLIEETDKIMNAQKARGADFSTGSLTKRARALFPILIPLFVSAFYRADDLAVAMECRCYRGGQGRTRMTRLKTAPRDYLALFTMLIFGFAVVFINRYDLSIFIG